MNPTERQQFIIDAYLAGKPVNEIGELYRQRFGTKTAPMRVVIMDILNRFVPDFKEPIADNNLREVMKEKRVSGKQLSEASGVSEATIDKLKARLSNPTLKTARLLAGVLQVGLDEIFPE